MSSIGGTGLFSSDFWVDEVIGESPITAWDILYMIGRVWPGLWKFTVKKELKVEVVNVSATVPNLITSPTITDKGYKPAEIKAVGRVWDRQSWIYLQELVGLVIPNSNSTPRGSYDISHPALYLSNISSVIVTGFLVHPPEDQILTIEFDMLEWFPATAVPAGQKVDFPNSVATTSSETTLPPGSSPDPLANVPSS